MDIINQLQTKLSKFQKLQQYYVGQSRYCTSMPDNILFFIREYELAPGSSWCSHEIIDKTNVLCGKLSPRYNRIAHHRHVMVMPFKGQGTLLLNDDRFIFKPGEVVYILPHQLHMMIASENILWIYLTFEMDSYDAFRGFANHPINFPEEAWHYLSDFLDCPLREKGDNVFAGMRASLNILQILNTILEHQSTSRITYVPKMDAFVDRINRLLYENLEKPLDLSLLAAQFEYSPNHLRKLYRDNMGITLGGYLRNLRHAHALTLLCNTSLPLEAIAKRCGYGSCYAFAAAFKQREGCPPGEYRNRRQSSAPAPHSESSQS